MKSSRLPSLWFVMAASLAGATATNDVREENQAGKRGLAGAAIGGAIFTAQVETNFQPRIVGGTPAEPGEYPFYVHVNNVAVCGGTLVHEDVVLTSASCFGAWFGNAFVGSTDVNGDGEQVFIESENIHPDYDATTNENDLMLVKLLDPSTGPVVTLNRVTTEPQDGLDTTVIGFGNTEEDGFESPELLEVDISVLDFDTCVDNLQEQLFPETQICAGDLDGGRDRCDLDEGCYQSYLGTMYVSFGRLTKSLQLPSSFYRWPFTRYQRGTSHTVWYRFFREWLWTSKHSCNLHRCCSL